MRISNGNVKMAMQSLRSARWRSWLTMFGIIIGIVSVVTIVSIGEGIKHQVSGQINKLGQDVLTVRPGRLPSGTSNTLRSLTSVINPSSNVVLTPKDLTLIQDAPHVAVAAPFSIVPGSVQVGSQAAPSNVVVIGTSSDFPTVLNQTLQSGAFFDVIDTNKDVAVIGNNLALNLFGASSPLGQTFTFRGQTFTVDGVLNSFNTPPLSMDADYNNTIFIPYQTANDLENGSAPLYQVLAKADSVHEAGAAKQAITAALQAAHGGIRDFSVLTQSQTLQVTSGILDLLTDLISAIAAISLLVGGIGIMNVMLVSVTERTHEIGIRKALGATNRQIRSQFITEATVLCVAGAIAAIIFSLLINAILRVATNLEPAISWQVMVLAIVISVAIGMVFGLIPAVKAARKAPIEALRNE